MPCPWGSCQVVLQPRTSPTQGWHLSERVLRDPWLSVMRRCCSTPSRPPSSPPGRPLFCCLFGEGLHHFSPHLVPQTAGYCGWDIGGQGYTASCCIAHGSLTGFRNGEGSPPCSSWLQLGPLSVYVNTFLLQWGLMRQRRRER